jgi:hypothetical protein
MGIRGSAPKDPSEVIRRNKPQQITVLQADGFVYGPDLPEKFVHTEWHPKEGPETSVHDWPEQTRIWWDVWRRSAQAAVMGETDWCFMLETAVLHAMYWMGDHRTSLAAEIRARVAKFGATPDDRQRLRVAVSAPQSRAVAVVRDDGRESQRARLLKSAGSC